MQRTGVYSFFSRKNEKIVCVSGENKLKKLHLAGRRQEEEEEEEEDETS